MKTLPDQQNQPAPIRTETNNPELAIRKCNPKESRIKLLEMIKGKGIVKIKDVIAFRRKEGLYFGPLDDTFDILLASQARGELHIDPIKGILYSKNMVGGRTAELTIATSKDQG